MSISYSFRVMIQNTIYLMHKGGYTTRQIFEKRWPEYDKMALEIAEYIFYEDSLKYKKLVIKTACMFYQKLNKTELKLAIERVRKIFRKWLEKYQKILIKDRARKIAAQLRRNFGRAFTNAVKAGEYKRIRYTGKNKQNASTFLIV